MGSSRSSGNTQASDSWASQMGQGGLRGCGQEELESPACQRGHRALLSPFLLQIRDL